MANQLASYFTPSNIIDELKKLVIKAQRFLSYLSILQILFILVGHVILIYIKKDGLAYYMLIIYSQILLVFLLICNVKNIKKPTIVTLSVECVGIFIYLASIAYFEHHIERLGEHYESSYSVFKQLVLYIYALEQNQEWLFIASTALSLADREILMISAFYAVRIDLLLNAQYKKRLLTEGV